MTILNKEKAENIVNFIFGADGPCEWWNPKQMEKKLKATCFLDRLFRFHTFVSKSDLMTEIYNEIMKYP
jgi:hypothetical protein